MKWLYLALFVVFNYFISTQLMSNAVNYIFSSQVVSSQVDSALDACLIILLILLGLIIKVRSRKNHRRIYAFAWGMVYGNIVSLFLLAGFGVWMYFNFQT